MKMTKFDQISFFVFLAGIFLLPFFFIPFTNFSLGVSKGILFSFFIIVSFILWIVGRFVSGSLIIPKSRTLLAGLILAAVFILSAFFSPVSSVSFLGGGFEVGTAGSLILGFMAMFLAINFFRNKKNNFYLYLALSSSFILIFISIMLNLIIGPGSFLSQVLPINLVGSWNDLAIFSGLIAIFSLISLEFLPLDRPLRILSGFILASALFVLVLVNFYSALVITGLASLFVFINSLILRRKLESFKFPAISFFLVVFFFILVIANGLIGNYLGNRLHIDNTEVRPSASATFEVTKLTLKENLLLGSGPNRFANSWMMFKPVAVNQTPLWDANFNYGVGLIPTTVATTGILGFLAWMLFFISLFISGLKSWSKSEPMDYGSSALLLFSSFLWLFAVIYTPNIVSFALAFILSGAFIGTWSAERKIKNFEMPFLKDPRIGFVAILILISFLSGIVFIGYGFAKKFISIVYFQKSALSASTPEGILQAEKHLSKASFFDENNDLYYRSISSLYLLELSNLANHNPDLTDDLRLKAQSLLSQAENAGRLAIAKDPTNYLNWLSLASIYEQVLPLGVAGAYDSGKQSILNAIALNPKNPGLYARLAKIEMANQNFSLAEEAIKKAIELRPNDQDLINFLDQLKARSL